MEVCPKQAAVLLLLSFLLKSRVEGTQKWETIVTTTPDIVQEKEVQQLIRRVIPDRHRNNFFVKIGITHHIEFCRTLAIKSPASVASFIVKSAAEKWEQILAEFSFHGLLHILNFKGEIQC